MDEIPAADAVLAAGGRLRAIRRRGERKRAHARWLHASPEHNVPFIAALLARFDGERWEKADTRLQWKLRAGRNTAEFQAINTGGVPGMTTGLITEYQP